MSARITNRIRPLLTSYLRAARGWALMGSLLRLIDQLGQAWADAASEALIETCSDDALDAHARNSNDRRAIIEDDAALRKYLKTRWDRWGEAGTQEGLEHQIERIGYLRYLLVSELDLRTMGIAGAFGGNVGFSFIIIRPPHLVMDGNLWGDGSSWGDGSPWGGTYLTTERLLELIFTLQKWRPFGVSFRFICIDIDGTTTFDGTGFHGSYLILPVSEPFEYLPGGAPTFFYNLSYLVP